MKLRLSSILLKIIAQIDRSMMHPSKCSPMLFAFFAHLPEGLPRQAPIARWRAILGVSTGAIAYSHPSRWTPVGGGCNTARSHKGPYLTPTWTRDENRVFLSPAWSFCALFALGQDDLNQCSYHLYSPSRTALTILLFTALLQNSSFQLEYSPSASESDCIVSQRAFSTSAAFPTDEDEQNQRIGSLGHSLSQPGPTPTTNGFRYRNQSSTLHDAQ